MKKTKTENIVSEINASVFFKEFTYSRNDFTALDSKQKLQFADNVVWLDNLFFIFQIKDRESNSTDDRKWFDNKVLKKGVKQIKSTLNYISEYPEIQIQNEKGHTLNVIEAKKCENIKKIIVYTPNKDFPKELRDKKFYESSEAGFIHLFHSEDYYWICEYLITPSEINQYLDFRENLYRFNKITSNNLPEQYFLGHFMETPDSDHFDPSYINNLKQRNPEEYKFDISLLMENFSKNILLINHETEYYPIISEIAKLNRSELPEFKLRLSLAIENCEKEEVIQPYIFYSQRTDCGFVFIPMHSKYSEHWKNALNNYTLMHKYDCKAKRCVGVVACKDKSDMQYYELWWQFIEEEWQYEEEIETALRDHYPFRKAETKIIENIYK